MNKRITNKEPLINQENQVENILDFRELFLVIWNKKIIILSVTSLFAIASLFYSLSLANEYKATAILMPASSEGGGGLSRLGGNIGGLASLAGINLGRTDGVDRSVMAIQLIKTWGFLESFIKTNKLEAEVFAAKNWNKSVNELVYDDDIYDISNDKWLRDPSTTQNGLSEPSGWELFEGIKHRISVSRDDDTGFITLTAEHYSPYIAKKWVDLLTKSINKELQDRDIKEISKRIAYLEAQIDKTSVAEMHAIFYELIKEQTQALMLAKVSDEYALKTLSPSKIAEKKSKPSRAIIVIFMTFLGGFLSVFLILVRYFMSIH